MHVRDTFLLSGISKIITKLLESKKLTQLVKLFKFRVDLRKVDRR